MENKLNWLTNYGSPKWNTMQPLKMMLWILIYIVTCSLLPPHSWSILYVLHFPHSINPLNIFYDLLTHCVNCLWAVSSERIVIDVILLWCIANTQREVLDSINISCRKVPWNWEFWVKKYKVFKTFRVTNKIVSIQLCKFSL